MTLTINHPSARVAYSLELGMILPQQSFFYKNNLIKPKADAKNAFFVEMTELMGEGSKAGYQVQYDIDDFVGGYTTPGDKNIIGKEGALKLYNDVIQINQHRKSFQTDGEFADSLVPHDARQRVFAQHEEYWPIWFDERLIIKASGAVGDGTWETVDSTAATSSARDVEGSVADDGNDLRAPSTDRIVYGDGTVVAQSTVTTSMTMTLDSLDTLLKKAFRNEGASTRRLIKPVMVNGRPTVIYMMDYISAFQLASVTSNRYFITQQALVQGGKESQITSGLLGVYSSPIGVDVMMMTHPKMVKFSAATTGGEKLVRNLLFGQSAVRIAYGRKAKKAPSYTWNEETDNRGNTLVVTAGNKVGIQKCAYRTTETGSTREDWGVVAHDLYGNW